MSVQKPLNPAELPTIQFEIVAEGGRDSDPAAAGVVARGLAEGLRQEGYSVQPAYTGEKGGTVYELLLQELLPPAILAIHLAWSHKETLINLFKAIGPLVEQVVKKQDQHLKLEVTVDGASISVEAPSLKTTEHLTELGQKNAEQLMELVAHNFEVQHPQIAEKVTPRSSLKVTVSVPPPPSRRRK
jgi:hypothetical protein